MRSMNGMMSGQAGAERARIAAEALDRVVPALRHDLDAGDDDEDEENEQEDNEDIEAEHSQPPRGVLARRDSLFARRVLFDLSS